MTLSRLLRPALLGGTVLTLAGCGSWFGNSSTVPTQSALAAREQAAQIEAEQLLEDREGNSTIWDVFESTGDPNTQVEVNKYIWNAALEILDFLPVQSVDPFTGVITTGYGTPPGGGRAYRATIYIQDPALDARSLKLALQTKGGGAVSRDTARAVEDAILTRARQLRIRDSKL